MNKLHKISVMGADEAGRGPVLGPLVVAAVAAPGQSQIRKLGVRDSKALKPKKREELAKIIRENYELEYQLISARDIDSFRRVRTLNQIEEDAFSSVIGSLLSKLENDCDISVIILDAADVNDTRFGNNVLGKIKSIYNGKIPDIISKHKADENYPVVSAASVIAKVIRDGKMKLLQEEYGNIGSGYPSDPNTKRFIRELFENRDPMPDFVRTSWETIKKKRDTACNRSLDEFF